MKNKIKILAISAILLSCPIDTLAYSEYIIPGGESIGIEIQSDGIMIVGFYKVDGKYNKGNPSLKVGDKITHVDGEKINKISELVSAMEKNADQAVELTVLRDNKEKTVSLELIKDGNTYKTGLFVKDEITGIGTLTYIDGDTFGSLGHNIVESNTNKAIEVKSGTIFRSSITGIDRSFSGSPGGKNAKFYSAETYGDITKNIPSGVYGKYTDDLPNKKALKVASLEEIELGKAQIYTVLNGEEVGKYDIEITRVDADNETKNIYFAVTDEELLSKTGGIVQGMSGSPIVQGDKIIGAVTHVVISNPQNGYGISIVSMLEDGEK